MLLYWPAWYTLHLTVHDFCHFVTQSQHPFSTFGYYILVMFLWPDTTRTGGKPQRLKKSKCHSHLQEEQEGPRGLQSSKTHLDPCHGYGADNPRKLGKKIFSMDSCMTSLIAVYDKKTGLLEEGRVSHNTEKSCWNMGWISRQWHKLKTSWIAMPRWW